MNKTEKRRLMQLAEEGIDDWIVFQRKPSTCVVVHAFIERCRYEGIGFAKVRWPDKWEPTYGAALAKKKAMADIARQAMEREKLTTSS